MSEKQTHTIPHHSHPGKTTTRRYLGKTPEIFKPHWPKDIFQFDYVGSFWWEATLTDEQAAELQNIGYMCEPYQKAVIAEKTS